LIIPTTPQKTQIYAADCIGFDESSDLFILIMLMNIIVIEEERPKCEIKIQRFGL
jgi:hypothetical protein